MSADSTAAGNTTLASCAGLHVLVVDDEEGARTLFRDFLILANARVTLASSARAALAVIDRDRPHVVVSDIMMPGEDGYWLVAELRRLEERDGTPLPAIAITGDSYGQPRERVLAAGFRDYLGKPFTIEVLCEAVAHVAKAVGAPAT